MSFIRVENLGIALTILAGVIAVVYLSNKFRRVKLAVIESFQQKRVFAISAGILLILLIPFIFRGSSYWIFTFTACLLWIMIALGLNIQFGTAGVINLGGALFTGVGGYTTAILTTRYGVPSFVGFIIGAVLASLVGLLLIYPILKCRGHYVALVTLASVVAMGFMLNNVMWLGGSQGVTNIPPFSIGSYSFLSKLNILGFELPMEANCYYLAVLIVGLAWFASYRLWDSWVGLTLNSISEAKGDLVCASCMGIPREKWIGIGFCLGNFLMGLAGAFAAHMNSYVAPLDVSLYRSLLYFSVVIIGGIDNIFGISLAAILLVILPEKFRFLQEYLMMIFMFLVLMILIFRPAGLIPARIRKYGIRTKTQGEGNEYE